MSDTLDLSTRRLADARQRGDADEIAEALAVHANALLTKGHIGAARSELDEAAAIHRARDRVYDEARCTHLAATLCRFEGRLDEARQRANRALALAGSRGPIAVSAHTELGEIALAEGQVAQAAAAFQAALDVGRDAGLVAPARAAILRRRAAALVAAKQFVDAIHDLETAYGLLIEAGDRATAARTLIEQATAFQHGDMGPRPSAPYAAPWLSLNPRTTMRPWLISTCCSRPKRSRAAMLQRLWPRRWQRAHRRWLLMLRSRTSVRRSPSPTWLMPSAIGQPLTKPSQPAGLRWPTCWGAMRPRPPSNQN